MNLNPGGKQPCMRDGCFFDANGQKKTQKMCFQPEDGVDPKLIFLAKGAKQVFLFVPCQCHTSSACAVTHFANGGLTCSAGVDRKRALAGWAETAVRSMQVPHSE